MVRAFQLLKLVRRSRPSAEAHARFGKHGASQPALAASRHRSEARSERGATIFLFTAILAVGFGIAALVIDHAREEVAVYQLQAAVDSAALAGARQLNGEIGGWWQAKRAAVLLMKNSQIHGWNRSSSNGLTLTAGDGSFWDRISNSGVNSAYSDSENGASPLASDYGTMGTAGNLTITVKRGIYWHEKDGNYHFLALEQTTPVSVGVNTFLVANAIQVEAKLDNFRTTLGGVFGVGSFGTLTRTAVAVMDQDLSFPSAPIAISLCNLLFNGNPRVMSGNRLRNSINPRMECERPGFATEVGAKASRTQLQLPGADHQTPPYSDSISDDDRRAGITRAEAYERKPYFYYDGSDNICFGAGTVGWGQNCAQLPNYASLGVSSPTPADTIATANQVADAFSTPKVTHIGDYFQPLMSLDGFISNPSLSQMVMSSIAQGQDTIATAFTTGPPGTSRVTNPNFPYTKVSRPSWSTTAQGDPQNRPPVGVSFQQQELYDMLMPIPGAQVGLGVSEQVQLQLADQSGNLSTLSEDPVAHGSTWESYQSYTNLLAHFNDPASNPVNSMDVGKTAEVYAMIIAPSRDHFPEHPESIVQYCNWEQTLSAGSISGQDAVAPILETQGRVVGRVKIRYFDFNFGRLLSTPMYRNLDGRKFYDRNPERVKNIYGDRRTDSQSYEDNYERYSQCVDADPNDSTCQKPDSPYSDIHVPTAVSLTRCFDFSHGDFSELLDRVHQIDTWDAQYLHDHPNVEVHGRSLSVLDVFRQFSQLLAQGIPARQGYPNAPHCLPQLRDPRLNPNLASSYEDIHKLASGVGIGGVRWRLADCDGAMVSAITGKTWSANSPALVDQSNDTTDESS